MKKCFGYARVSTKKQGEGVSLDAQRDAISAYASSDDIVIVKWFEETVTAAKSGRPQFEKMLAELKAGKASGVVFHKIDRASRNLRDWNEVQELHDAGVEVHFAHESHDLSTRGGRLSANIQAVVAADFIRNNRDEAMKGFSRCLKEGLYPLAPPVGYLSSGKKKPKEIVQCAGR